MARGITETDVHTAADELVAAGERPTVDRIRAHLGTGSPNTVTRHLDTWWQGLGRRLHTQQVRLAVPDAPDAVATLAGQWWALALDSAKTSLQASLAADQRVLEEERAALHRERERLEAEASALRAQTEAAGQAELIATTQLTELQRLVRRLEGQLEELTQQRDAATAREVEARGAKRALEARLQALQDTAQSERASLAAHVQALENRAHAEVDRARQEVKELQGRLTAVTKNQAASEASLRQALDEARTATAEASRSASSERARADALEKQLSKLQDLPAALEAAMRRRQLPLKPRKSVSKRANRGAEKQP
ncbi:DNA-binding protein [Pseudoxanthomonas japonensis]|uniref:DNA-binding protein n=1 Tax=Pseudoxanthomonas japonensis TaxID=69284 RepID=UPI0037489F35